MSMLLLALFLVLIVLVRCANWTRSVCPPGTQLPPGPPGKPLIGNLLDLPKSHTWLTFKGWADRYGPIFRFTLLGRNMVVLSTEKAANDLLRERGSLYSSREQLPMAAQLMSRNMRTLLQPYNERWRNGRKLMHILTMPVAATSYEPVQIYESERLLYDLLREPARYEELFERYAGAVIMRLAYAKTIESDNDPHIRRALEVVHTVERVASPGSYLVDTFPFLMYLPTWCSPFKKEAERLHQRELTFFRDLMEEVRVSMKRPACPPSFMRTFLERQEEFRLTDDEGAYVIGTLFEAGSGTTAAAMMSFCLAMCHYPDWQRTLQEEVDSVVGDDRLPAFSDMPSLPVVRAVVKEVLRWRPVTAGGVPHQLIKDDTYQGFYFPAGTVVHANQWAIHRDPQLYPDPETFNPARWLEKGYPTYREPLSKFPNIQNYSAFGFGRRICPGMNIAERSLNILVARIAWASSITKKPGVSVPWYDYTTGFNVQPNPFQFDLAGRSEKRLALVARSWAEGKKRDSMAP